MFVKYISLDNMSIVHYIEDIFIEGYRMDANEFKALQTYLDFTNFQMAKQLGHSLRAVAHWRAGTRSIPGAVEKLMEYMVKEQQNYE